MNLDDLPKLLAIELLDKEIPEWANWVTVDSDGWVFVHRDKPSFSFETRMDHEGFHCFFDFYWKADPEDGTAICLKIINDFFVIREFDEAPYIFGTEEIPEHDRLCINLNELL